MSLLGVFSRLKYANAGVAAWATLGPFSLALLLVLGAIIYANTPRADAKLFDQLGFLALISGALCLVSLGASLLFENLQRKRRFSHRYISILGANRGYEEPNYAAAISASLLLVFLGTVILVAVIFRLGAGFLS